MSNRRRKLLHLKKVQGRYGTYTVITVFGRRQEDGNFKAILGSIQSLRPVTETGYILTKGNETKVLNLIKKIILC